MKKGIIITIIFLVVLLVSGVVIGVTYTNFKNEKTFNEPYVFIETNDKGRIIKYVGKDREVTSITDIARGDFDSVYDAKNDVNVIYSTGETKFTRIDRKGKSKVVNLCKRYSSIENCKISYLNAVNIDTQGNMIMLLNYDKDGYGFSNLVVINDKLKLIYNEKVDAPVADITLINKKAYLLCWYHYSDTGKYHMKIMSVDYKNKKTKTIKKEKSVHKDNQYINILNNNGKYNILYQDKKLNYILKDSSNNNIFKVNESEIMLNVVDDVGKLNFLFSDNDYILKQINGKKVSEYNLSEYGDYLVDIDFINDDIFTVIGNSLFIFDSNNLDKEPKEYLYGIDELIDDNRDIALVSFFAGE